MVDPALHEPNLLVPLRPWRQAKIVADGSSRDVQPESEGVQLEPIQVDGR